MLSKVGAKQVILSDYNAETIENARKNAQGACGTQVETEIDSDSSGSTSGNSLRLIELDWSHPSEEVMQSLAVQIM